MLCVHTCVCTWGRLYVCTCGVCACVSVYGLGMRLSEELPSRCVSCVCLGIDGAAVM